MNKSNLVSGTIKGIQIVDLEKKIHNKNSSKYYAIKFNKTKHLNNFNNSINNDSSLISPKDNISNKNTSISSKPKPQPKISISSNQNNTKNIKIKRNIMTKDNKRNLIKIKSNQKNNNKNMEKPIEQKQKELLVYKEKRDEKKVLSYSKNKKINTQISLIRKIDNSNPKKKAQNPIKKLKSEPLKKCCFICDNYGENINNEYKILYEKEQKRKLKLVFKRILAKNNDMEQISSLKSIHTSNFEINSSLDNINCYKDKKDIFYSDKDKNGIKLIKKSKTNNREYIISKDKNEKEKNENNYEFKEKKPLNNIINKKIINKSNFYSNNNDSLYSKENSNHKLNNSNSLGTIKDNYKNYNLRNLSNIKNNNDIADSTFVNGSYNIMNNTFNNNIYRLNITSKNKNNSKIHDNKIYYKRYDNSKNNKQKSKLNNYINNGNKIFNKKESENLNKSPVKNKQINIIMIHSNAKNNINQNRIVTLSNKNKEKEIIKEGFKDKNNQHDMSSKKEMIKKIKTNNYKKISSQKNRKNSHMPYHYHNINNNIKGSGNINKHKIIKKIKNNYNNNNNNKIYNLKGNIKGSNILNETNINNIDDMNSILKNNSKKNSIKNSVSPKNCESKILTSNNSCEELPFNKIISIQKINTNNNKIYEIINYENVKLNSKNQKRKKIEESFNNKNSASNINQSFNIGKNINFNNSINSINSNNNEIFNKTLNIYEKSKKTKKIISISCSLKNQKDLKTKIKVHRRQQSMINQNNQYKKNVNQKINNINILLKNKNNPQTINIDLQNDPNNKNKNKIKYSAKKFLYKGEPISPKQIISKYKKYLKEYEIEELKELYKKGELVYYLGEIHDRIIHKDNTFSKVNQSFIISNKNKEKNKLQKNNKKKFLSLEFNNNSNEEDKIFINRSCNNFREGKDKKLKEIKNKFEQNIFNDEEGDYKLIIGSHLNYRYEIIECIGKGSFGEAIKCYDYKNKDLVCIKIINSQDKFQNQALTEIKILSTISANDINNDSNNVKFYNHFNFRGHICLVFELLGKNLYEYLQLNNFLGIDITQIKNYTMQILFSLLFLRNVNIIHCDLKPENVLLFQNNPNQIKVIDFGSSCFEKERIYLYIQSRFYRAPEVLLDLGYNYEIDIWSLGCIIYELYTGNPIFPGINEMEQIYLIMEKIGAPPSYIIENSPKSRIFFDNNLKPFKFKDESGNYFKPGSKKIKDILKDAPDNLIDFINKCLLWNPLERLTPDKALLHPFIIEDMNGTEFYKHKLKVKHMKYGMNNNDNKYNYINSTRNKCHDNKEIINYRGSSCNSNKNSKKISLKINNNELIYMNTVCSDNEEIKKNYAQNYSVTQGNNNKFYNCNIVKKNNKKLPLSIDVDMNFRRINTTENNENYRKISKHKKNKKKLQRHLPKKKSLGRTTNYKIIKNAYK